MSKNNKITQQEAQKLINWLKDQYPSLQPSSTMASTWRVELEKYNKDEIKTAIRQVRRKRISEFAPSLSTIEGQILENRKQARRKKEEEDKAKARSRKIRKLSKEEMEENKRIYDKLLRNKGLK